MCLVLVEDFDLFSGIEKLQSQKNFPWKKKDFKGFWSSEKNCMYVLTALQKLHS